MVPRRAVLRSADDSVAAMVVWYRSRFPVLADGRFVAVLLVREDGSEREIDRRDVWKEK